MCFLIFTTISLSYSLEREKLPKDPRVRYAVEILDNANLRDRTILRIDTTLNSAEAFSIRAVKGKTIITGGGAAGLLYGANEYAAHPEQKKVSQSPDFSVRGNALLLMKEGSYDYKLTPEEFPWFYDRDLLTKYLDYLFANHFNCIFLWSGHLFPSIVELPEYPDATDLSKVELIRNQQQFQWLTDECAKRNINVLLHFYNIYISEALAKSRNIPQHYGEPDDFAKRYLHYTLLRFINKFPSVGLYVCPGEVLKISFRPVWIRDVIFSAAKESGKHPLIVIRDWGLDKALFEKECIGQYDNFYTELKHNVEMLISPYPDIRHAEWIGKGNHHIVNLHEVSDIKPFRWGSIDFIKQMVGGVEEDRNGWS